MIIFEPDPLIAAFIKAFVVVESRDPLVNRLLPDTAVVASIRLKGSVQFPGPDGCTCLPNWSISGLRKTYRLVEYGEDTSNILILFREGGAGAFIDLPMHELFETNLSLDHFFRSSILMVLEERLALADSIAKKVPILQNFLIANLHFRNADPIINGSIERIKAVNGSISITALSSSLNMSLDAFEKRFRKTIGSTPKQYADIVRMKSLLQGPMLTSSLLDMALDAGFFDQSHFNSHFKKFTGLTPKEFMAASQEVLK